MEEAEVFEGRGMMLKKYAWMILFLFFAGGFSGKAAMVHDYTFDASDPYADSVGSADLTLYGSVGSITMNSGGYASFSGADSSAADVVYLSSSAAISNYNPFVLSLWFRISTTNQLDYSSMFSSNPSSGDGFQINFLGGWLSVNTHASSGQVLNVIPTADLATNQWHLITIMQDPNAAEGGQVWLDDTKYGSTNAIFGALNAFRLGVNRNGKKGFYGDLSEVSIYDGESWDSTKQDAAFSTGPVVPEPAVFSFILFSSVAGLFVRRIFK
jgi:hypothetical protein